MKKQILTLFLMTISLASLPIFSMEEQQPAKKQKTYDITIQQPNISKLIVILQNSHFKGEVEDKNLPRERETNPTDYDESENDIDRLEKELYNELANLEHVQAEQSHVDSTDIFSSKTIEFIIDDPTEIALLLSESAFIREYINNQGQNNEVSISLLPISEYVFADILAYLKNENTNYKSLNNEHLIEILKAGYYLKIQKLVDKYISIVAEVIVNQACSTDPILTSLFSLPLELQNNVKNKITHTIRLSALDTSFPEKPSLRILGDEKETYNRCLAFSPDGNQMALHDTAVLCLYDTSNPDNIRVTQRKNDHKTPYSVTFNPNNSSIATTGDNTIIRIYANNDLGLILNKNTDQYRIKSIAYSPNGTIMAAASLDGKVGIYDSSNPNTITHITQIDNSSDGNSIALSSNGILAATRNFREVVVFDITDLTTISEIQIIQNAPNANIAISPQGTLMSIIDVYKTIRVYDISDINNIFLIKTIHESNVPKGFSAVAFNYDSSLMAVASINGNIYIYDIINLEHIKVVKEINNTKDMITTIAFNSQNNLMATRDLKGTIHVYDLRSLHKLLYPGSLEELVPMLATLNNNNNDNNNNL